MAEHRIIKDNIIYIIPTDELYLKLTNDEAYIDEYGRLINRKPHRVLKELKHYAVSASQGKTSVQQPIAPKGNLIVDYAKDKAFGYIQQKSYQIVDKGVDKIFDEIIPKIWHDGIVPTYYKVKDALTTKELKVNTIQRQIRETDGEKPVVKMTKEEADTEKRKLLYHWIGMLESFRKLQNAGELDAKDMAQLTNPEMLEKVNCYLSENPNLLETKKYILLQGLLGRNLYKEDELLPIKEIDVENAVKKDLRDED